MTAAIVKNARWLHLGAGAFHRAHQAWYLHLLQHQAASLPTSPRWSLSLANIRNSATQHTLQQLARQQGRYTLEVISPEGETRWHRLAVIDRVILWDAGLASLVAEGAHPQTKVISFTVTEGGYFLRDDGRLDETHPAVASDLAGQGETQTLYGALVKILRARREANAGAVTLLSCDNLRHNGDVLRRGLLAFIAASGDEALGEWVASHTTSPNNMVDRITPVPDAGLPERLAAQGIADDKVPLTCEAFTQWVMEDRFIAGRPPLEQVGVEFVDDVTPWEEVKIRVLNASHSGIAWAGGLLGKASIDQSLLPTVTRWLSDYVRDDLAPTLAAPGIDLDAYCASTLHRFSNPGVRDSVQRVSSDSIAKLHEFIVPTLKARYAQGVVPRAALMLPALLFCFMQREQRGELAFAYQDRARASVDFLAVYRDASPVRAFAAQPALFGSLCQQPTLAADLQQAVDRVEAWLAGGEGAAA
ncbi:D-arabinitol 4-dehydrogenase [Pantoea sp. 1.19]|uniref:D-arabinitol 4-dehydrogenase n=1 Tax=Pantoea sp. 1.19 TaxID=1925589 RepID=UPI00094911B3|nr:D-arabinitol 4-dehydrogenase [Pantoea sp. 1.19]